MVSDKVDFHCHTVASKDCLSKPEDVVAAAKKAGLTKLVITDHNSIQGALAARQFAPDFVIVGEEIMTTHGEILAAFVQEEIPAGLHPMKVLEMLRAQNAFISLSHPYDVHRKGHWDPEFLQEMLPFLDAIEGFNSRCVDVAFNQKALKFAASHAMPITVGSDAHSLFEIGRSYLDLPVFETADQLRENIRQANPVTRLSSPLVHLTSRWAVITKNFPRILK